MISLTKSSSARDIVLAYNEVTRIPNFHSVIGNHSGAGESCHPCSNDKCCGYCIRERLPETKDCNPCFFVVEIAKKIEEGTL